MIDPRHLYSSLLAGLLTVACVPSEQVRQEAAATLAKHGNADGLLVVDCLLPGQVRRLGSQMTYLSARRPIQTTAQDCEIRGGEYVAYDRATLDSALRIWLPLAQKGDPDAENKVGEIYERGLQGKPDYEMAALWYKRAAEQGFKRAQINLAFLYEKGRGVPRDLKRALHWYRKASNLPAAVLIDQRELDNQRLLARNLRQELAQTRRLLQEARQELRNRERQLQRQQRHLRELMRQGKGNASARQATQRLQEQLAREREALARSRQRIEKLEAASHRQRERLAALRAEGGSLRAQLQSAREELQRAHQDLEHYQQLALASESQLKETRTRLQALSKGGHDEAARRRIRELEQALAKREKAMARQRRTMAELQRKVQRWQERLSQAKGGDRQELERLRRQLAQTQTELDRYRERLAAEGSALKATRKQLAGQTSLGAAASATVQTLQKQLAERERILKEQRRVIEQLRRESEQWKGRLAELEQKAGPGTANVSRTEAGQVPFAPPTIQLIDPPLLAVRGAMEVAVRGGIKQRAIVGQVDSPGGLYALTVNGVDVTANERGLFKADIPILAAETPVTILAVDRHGKQTKLAFSLVRETGSQQVKATRVSPLKDVPVGKYYALVIGNQDYQFLPDLDTARYDATEVAKVLRERFGFDVRLLLDATRYQILSELNKLRKQLTENDNLLLYYAGHGELDRVNMRGHWLPVDAEAGNTANWISNIAITDILNAMSVRHVLVVADSCYSGALTRSALTNLEAGKSDETRRFWLKTIAKMRSRTVLTSGGLAPVLDGGGGRHSVFAKSLLDVLRTLDDVQVGEQVYRKVSAQVAYAANRYQVEQVPEYAPIKYAGHESGDFIFVPKSLLN